MKCFIILTMLTTLSQKASSLNCYTTDLSKIKTGYTKTTMENCENYMKKILEERGVKNAKLPENVEFSCFSIALLSDSKDVAVKGCVPKNGCGLVQKIVKSKLRKRSWKNHLRNVECHECDKDGCNKVEAVLIRSYTKEIEA